MGSTPVAAGLNCSFCRKDQDDVAKLFRSANLPRAYICDECVAVCAMVIEEDRAVLAAPFDNHQPAEEPHPLLSHPLATPLLTAVEHWIRSESLGADAAEDMAEVRSIAIRMITA